jgi:hypothetical protein
MIHCSPNHIRFTLVLVRSYVVTVHDFVFCKQSIFMRTATRLLLLSLVIFFTACEKEVDYATDNTSGTGGTGGNGGTGNTNSTSNIEGEYDFVGMTAHTVSSITVEASGSEIRAVTTSDYVTRENTGTMKITSDQFISTNLAYSIDTVVNVKTYLDNVLFDDSDVPYAQSAPPSSTTTPYVRNSADSITATGAMGIPSDPSGAIPTGQAGFKLSWSGDTLLLKLNTSFNQSVSQNGVPGTMLASINGTLKLKKH